ncbi:MAG TPA: hypothetical protein VKR32_05645 [Puia sp.]|nr:hypothetical protein [Puia sp.]
MATVGYSGKPLFNKLGIKEDMRVLLIGQPQDYFSILEVDISNQIVPPHMNPDFVHIFARTQHEYEVALSRLKNKYAANPKMIIWVSWHKKSAKIPTDLTEDTIRNYALKNDLVDIKVCAVSEQWSGLKLVVSKSKR